ncbi:MAG: hypothetical protein N2508_13785 [Anaerolineae bacterium]|nr:hypothetical protein [Anaerolineae bacterium]
MRDETRTRSENRSIGRSERHHMRLAVIASVVTGCCLAVVSLWFSSWLQISAFILGAWIARTVYKIPGASSQGLRYRVTPREHAIAIAVGLLCGVSSGALQALVCFLTTGSDRTGMSQILPLSCRIHSVAEIVIGGTLFTSFFILVPIGIVALWFRHLAHSAEGEMDDRMQRDS